MRVKGNLQLMKEINTAMIMNLLHREGRMTRAELTKATKLSATTVSALIEDLIGRGIVREAGEKASPGAGRRAIALEIDKDGGYVIGISLGNRHLICAVLDLHGQSIAEFRTNIAIGNESIAEQIRWALGSCVEQTESMTPERIRGIGIAAPGLIDETEGVVLYSSLLKLSDFDLRRRVSAYYPGVPVKLVNDSNAAAFAERYAGVAKDRQSLLYMTINDGIGAGLVLNAQIYSGYLGAAGEIGHVSLDPQGEICNCGQRGCLETILTRPYILAKCRAEAARQGVEGPADFDEALARYDAGEAWLEPIFGRVIETARQMIASAAHLVSPEVVVLDGWMNRSAGVLRKLREAFDRRQFPFAVTGDRLLPAAFGEKGALYGSATLMLHQIFSAPVLD
ncbi:ROK family transcriptional regulator [Paenibacillaceae bacterium WGS1546]|uniref:ROK family transcriptional regulator n=1 Tax=Cohnella sp. WGS1546 TaxID=3366810 RepID=UPI00372D3F54